MRSRGRRADAGFSHCAAEVRLWRASQRRRRRARAQPANPQRDVRWRLWARATSDLTALLCAVSPPAPQPSAFFLRAASLTDASGRTDVGAAVEDGRAGVRRARACELPRVGFREQATAWHKRPVADFEPTRQLNFQARGGAERGGLRAAGLADHIQFARAQQKKTARWPARSAASFTLNMDTLGFEPRAFRMRSGCDATTPCAP